MKQARRGGPSGIDVDCARPKHLSAADQAIKDALYAKTRGNLAAMVCDRWGIDPARGQDGNHWHRLGVAARDFAHLADMLGLEPR